MLFYERFKILLKLFHNCSYFPSLFRSFLLFTSLVVHILLLSYFLSARSGVSYSVADPPSHRSGSQKLEWPLIVRETKKGTVGLRPTRSRGEGVCGRARRLGISLFPAAPAGLRRLLIENPRECEETAKKDKVDAVCASQSLFSCCCVGRFVPLATAGFQG